MGTFNHTAIIVTGSEVADAKCAHAQATKLGLFVTSIVTVHNGFASFLIVPDGGKDRRDIALEAAERRRLWIEWVSQRTHKIKVIHHEGTPEQYDARLSVQWIEILYGEHYARPEVGHHNKEPDPLF